MASEVIQPVCSKCSTTGSVFWYRKGDNIYCNVCNTALETENRRRQRTSARIESAEANSQAGERDESIAKKPVVSKKKPEKPNSKTPEKPNSKPAARKDDTDNKLEDNDCNEQQAGCTRRTTRQTGTCTAVVPIVSAKPRPGPSNTAKKGKGRRSIVFKKMCYKAPTAVANMLTSKSVFYKGQVFTVGDIVSCMDPENNKYYGQLRGFMTDQYCEKSGVISWLLPTTRSPPPGKGFDPTTYVMGMDEDIPRKLECFEFVMHAPHCFKINNGHFPPPHNPNDYRNIYTAKFLPNTAV